MRLPTVSALAYRRITFAALVALVVIVVTGGAVRVTGSGLGCPDWPTCNDGRIVAELEFHPMVEFVNRAFTGVVSLAVALAVLGSLRLQPRRTDLTGWSIGLVVGVAAQAILGGMTVNRALSPPFVMAHFLLSMVLVWMALVLQRRAGQPDARPHPITHRDYQWLGRVVVVLTITALGLGTVVTGTGPHGGDPDAARLDFALEAVTRAHSSVVWLLVGVTVLTVWRLKVASASATLVRKGEYVIGALLAQGAIGYLQYAFELPRGLVLIHIAGATGVWIAVVVFMLAFSERWETPGIAAYDG